MTSSIVKPRTGAKRRVAGIMGGMAAVALALTGCGGGTPAAEDTPESEAAPEAEQSEAAAPVETEEEEGPTTRADADLVIWADNTRADILKPFAEEFGKKNGVTVEVQYVNDVRSDFNAATKSGTGPDVIVGAHDWLGEFVQNGSVAPINMGAEKEAEFQEAAINATKFEGQTYAVPYAIETLALIRNKALAPEAPATLDDLRAKAKELTDAGTASQGLLLQVGQTGDAYFGFPLFSAFGGGYLGKADNGDYDPHKVIVNSPETVKGAELVKSLADEGLLNVNIEGANVDALFAEGDVPFFVTGPWAINSINEAGIDYEITPLPSVDGREMSPFYTVQMFYVAANAANPILAEEFVLNMVATEEVQVALFEAGKRVPAMKSAYESLVATNPELKIWADQAAKAELMPNIPAMNSVWAPVGQAEADIVSGKAEPQAAMDNAQKQVEEGINAG